MDECVGGVEEEVYVHSDILLSIIQLETNFPDYLNWILLNHFHYLYKIYMCPCILCMR